MSNRLSDAKIEQIAAEYIKQGYNYGKCLLACGYSEAYSKQCGLKLFNNQRVIDAIKRKQADLGAKIEYNKTKAEGLLMDLLERCRLQGDRSNEIAVLREMNTINALRTENINTYDNTKAIELSESERAEAERIAQIRLKQG